MSNFTDSVSSRPPTDIMVHTYRQILIWPLLLKDHSALPSIQDWASCIKGEGTWVEVARMPPATDESTPVPPATDHEYPTYEEIVYFHPFVRDFLYGDGGSIKDDLPLRRLRRTDVSKIEITISDAGQEYRYNLNVDRIELYLCDPSVAILVVEVSYPSQSETRFTLYDAMILQNKFRQAYPRFFTSAGEQVDGPDAFRWILTVDEKKRPVPFEPATITRDTYARFTYQAGEAPVAYHWKWLLEPLKPYRGPQNATETYQQVLDDCIPAMTFLAVDNPREISEGDTYRIVFCDRPGKAIYPYDRDFLNAQYPDYLYNRYWRRTPDLDLPPGFALTTMYLCVGYQFVIIGSVNDSFYVNHVENHFRRQYFRIGLLAHFQRAALLKFKDDLSDAIKILSTLPSEEGLGNAVFRMRLTHMQVAFLKFVSRSWFTEVSNQLQGREIYAWWSRQLDTNGLYNQVNETCQRLYAVVSEYETRLLSKIQERLAKLAAIWLPISILLAAVSADLLRPWHRDDGHLTSREVFGWVALLSSLGALAVLVSMWTLRWVNRVKGRHDRTHNNLK